MPAYVLYCCIHIFAYIYVNIYVYVYVCISMYIYIYICIFYYVSISVISLQLEERYAAKGDRTSPRFRVATYFPIVVANITKNKSFSQKCSLLVSLSSFLRPSRVPFDERDLRPMESSINSKDRPD